MYLHFCHAHNCMFCTAKNGEFFPLRHIIEALTTISTFFPPNSGYISELINDGMGERDEGKWLILNRRCK